MLSSITIEVESSRASTADAAKATPAAMPAGGCQAHSARPASGSSTPAKTAISATRGSTRAAIQPAERTYHSAYASTGRSRS